MNLPLRREILSLLAIAAVWLAGYWIFNAADLWLRRPREFTFHAPDYADKVYLAGSFNNWVTQDPPFEMMETGTKGVFRKNISLSPSRYEYKFFVTLKPVQEFKMWFEDLGAELEEDGYGGKNSVVRLKSSQTVDFEFRDAPPYAKSVVITGSFDQWQGPTEGKKDRCFLRKDPDGVWRGSFLLPAGRSLYKFLVNPDDWNKRKKEQWFRDPSNPETSSADVSNPADLNSVIKVHTIASFIFFFNLAMASLLLVLLFSTPAIFLVQKILKWNLSIVTKFVIVSVMVSCLTALIIFTVDYFDHKKTLESELRRQTNLVDAWITDKKIDFHRLDSPEVRKNLDASMAEVLHDLVYSFKGKATFSRFETDINAIAVYDGQGRCADVRLVRILDTGLGDNALVNSLEKADVTGSSGFTVRKIYKSDLSTILPIHSERGDYTLLINFDRHRFDAEHRIFYQRKLFVFLILLGIGSVMSLVMSKALLSPVKMMASVMRQVKEPGYGQTIRLETRDELEDLVNAFNTMSSEIKRYHDMRADELMGEKTKMQALLFSVEDGIAMVDFQGNILMLNDRAKKMLGIKRGYPYEKKFVEYVSNDLAREKLAGLLRGERTSEAEFTIPGDGGEVFLKVTKNLVTTAGKKETLGLVLALRDVTLEKELENMKDDFVHSITHDLKSPLTSVQGFLKLFLDGEVGSLTQDQIHYMEVMTNSTKKVLKLISNILDMAKLEAGKMTLNKTEWDILSAVDQIVESLQGTAKHLKISLDKRVVPLNGNLAGDSPKILLRVDGTLMERVITNLLDNALKFTPSQGRIEVVVKEHPDKVEVTVSDTGKGIPSDSLDKVFQKFKQVPGTKGGTGLGLTIVKHIVEAHGGGITVESEVGKGTTFRFWVPKDHTSV